MNILIIKLGATGDVVRTTPLLRRLNGRVTWVTAAKNVELLRGVAQGLNSVSWEHRESVRNTVYDLAVNLEDDLETAQFLHTVRFHQLFGAYADSANQLRYTADARAWFDLSLISVYGREKADYLKFQNRRTYQELVFRGLGLAFEGERYLLPKPVETGLVGDIAISTAAGPVWPMKNWAYYDRLKEELEAQGLVVNFLPKRNSLLEHLADVQGHQCLVSGDSLPMHLALGSFVRCVSLFTCTSPWEIFEYGQQTKIVSPLLAEFFYKREFDARATTAISLDEVRDAVVREYLKGTQAARVESFLSNGDLSSVTGRATDARREQGLKVNE
jgi:heptosyltransferase-2